MLILCKATNPDQLIFDGECERVYPVDVEQLVFPALFADLVGNSSSRGVARGIGRFLHNMDHALVISRFESTILI